MNAKANIKEHTLRVLFYVALLMGLCSIPIFVFTKTVISAVVPPFAKRLVSPFLFSRTGNS